MKKIWIAVLALLALAAALAWCRTRFMLHPQMVLTGVVTTDAIMVSPEISGRIEFLEVGQGQEVTNGQELARIQPRVQLADLSYYASAEGSSLADLDQARAEVAEEKAALKEALANLGRSRADAENARLNLLRIGLLYSNNVESIQSFDQARTTDTASQAGVESSRAQWALAQARLSSAEARMNSVRLQMEAAGAQKQRADAFLDYTHIMAPTNGVVDTRVVLQGEMVNAGQTILTLINPDDLWVRADVEETYVEQIRLGDVLPVKLPSGDILSGTVFYRGVDADYATQRDVSRTKRDIRTFEIRLRCDNRDRRLAVGMTAYVIVNLPASKPWP